MEGLGVSHEELGEVAITIRLASCASADMYRCIDDCGVGVWLEELFRANRHRRNQVVVFQKAEEEHFIGRRHRSRRE